MNDNFDLEDSLSEESLNVVLSAALLSASAYAFPNLQNPNRIELLQNLASSIHPRRSDKAVNVYNIVNNLKDNDLPSYSALVSSFSDFSNVKNQIKEKILAPENLKDHYAWMLAFVSFGYSFLFSSVDYFWESFDACQARLYKPNKLISLDDFNSFFGDGSSLREYKISYLNSGPKTASVIYLMKYINVEGLFTGSAPQINIDLMKDSEMQSYRLSGSIYPEYYSGDLNYPSLFNKDLNECQETVISGEAGYLNYPCVKKTIKPRKLVFNQLIFDGPYCSGSYDTAKQGGLLLRKIENENYSADRLAYNRKNNLDSYFASYSGGWIFDEFTGEQNVTFLGDIAAAQSIDDIKTFPKQADSGIFHFLGSQIFTTGSGENFHYTGFTPIFLRLDDSENNEIYSGLEINLFDKKKNSGTLMAYSWSTEKGILSDHNSGENVYPSLNISIPNPSLPFLGASVEFSSKTFKKLPRLKFNFGYTDVGYNGAVIHASDFSFTGFDYSGDEYFGASSGKFKFLKDIKNHETGLKVSPVFSTEKDFYGNTVFSSDKFLLQKTLGFSSASDNLISGGMGVLSHYGVPYNYIKNDQLKLNPPDVENLSEDGVVGDYSVLKYVSYDNMPEKQIFGPLDERSDSNLGTGFFQKIINKQVDKNDYKFVRSLNPARYFKNLFASNVKVFTYPNAKKIYEDGSPLNTPNQNFPYKVYVTYEVEEEFSKIRTKFNRSAGVIQKSFASLENDTWVDEHFSHVNYSHATPGGGLYFGWTFQPSLVGAGSNKNGIIHTNINANPSINLGKIQTSKKELFFDFEDEVTRPLDIIPFGVLSKKYEITLDFAYTLPVKQLSTFANNPTSAHEALVSTGDTSIKIFGSPPIGITDGIWSVKLNSGINSSYGQDPLFQQDLDGTNHITQNLSGDSWNAFYIKSGAVDFPYNYPPGRVASYDSRLFLAHDNLNNLRVFVRNSDVFPTFSHDPFGNNQFKGKSLIDYCFESERQKTNFLDKNNSCFEISGLSIFSGGLNQPTYFGIEKTGRLFHEPKAAPNIFGLTEIFLPKLTDQEHSKIVNLYPNLNKFTFYSGMDAYSKSVSGYFIDYKETSSIKLTPKSYKVHLARFPKSDHVFEFDLSGKMIFSGELSYNSQEESSIISHGIKIEEQKNELDKYQEMGYLFSYASPILKNRAGTSSFYDFPTKQDSRKNKIISEKNQFLGKNFGNPLYHNHFHMGVIPEFCFFYERGALGKPYQDNLLFPVSELVSSSSYDFEEKYDDGNSFSMKKIDKIYEVTESKRFYDSFFCDSVINSGAGFVENLPIGKTINANKECKQFWSPSHISISELVLGEEKISFISKEEDRSVNLSGLRDEMRSKIGDNTGTILP